MRYAVTRYGRLGSLLTYTALRLQDDGIDPGGGLALDSLQPLTLDLEQQAVELTRDHPGSLSCAALVAVACDARLSLDRSRAG